MDRASGAGGIQRTFPLLGAPGILLMSARTPYLALAYTTLTVHFAVAAFIVFGGLLVWANVVPLWAHLPIAIWGVLVHTANLTCPLTPLEKWLRRMAGAATYDRGFVERYLMPRRFRSRVTHAGHVAVGAAILVVNAAIYSLAYA
ncbi:MAG: DUF2784 domain-containing protein [Gemmatimonadaceae bacterium]